MYTALLAAEETPKPILGIFYPGETVGFLLVLIFGILIVYYVDRARKGAPIPDIRKIPGLEAIDEAIGRATEMGKPVLYNIGMGDITNPDTIASLPILEYVTKTCAKYDTQLVEVNRNYVVYGVADEVVKQAYMSSGKPELYDPNNVRWYSDEQFGFSTAVMGIMYRDLPAANLMLGSYAAESLLLAETGAVIETVQIAGTTNVLQIPFFVATCDYTLLGEELYAASAYISRDPVLVASIIGQDFMKIALVVIMCLGTVLATIDAHHWLVKLLQY